MLHYKKICKKIFPGALVAVITLSLDFTADVTTPTSLNTAGEWTNRSPEKKRTRLGEINFNQEQVQALLDKKSTHEAELEQV